MNFANIDMIYILKGLIIFIIAGSLHEFAHAFSAGVLGDDTAKKAGRRTINPVKHIDPIGTILIPLISAITKAPILGWMIPVPINPNNFRQAERGMAISSFCGPLSNFLQASFALILNKILFMIAANANNHFIVNNMIGIMDIYIRINLVLMIFNLIPFPPLDGGWILRFFLPTKLKILYDSIYQYGFILLYVLFFLGLLKYLLIPYPIIYNFFNTLLNSSNFFLIFIPVLISLFILFILFRKEILQLVKREKSKKEDQSSINEKMFINNSQVNEMKIILNKLDKGEALSIKEMEFYEKVKSEKKEKMALCLESDFNIQDQNCESCEYLSGCFLRKMEKYLKDHLPENTTT